MVKAEEEIILINLPPGDDYSYESRGCTYPATGILLIGSLLKKRGYQVVIIDAAVDEQYQDKVLRRISDKTLFIGFSVMTSQIMMAYKLAQMIKGRHPRVRIVFGGMHPTLFPEQTVNNDYIDIAVINEGTRTVMEILDYIKGTIKIGDLKGISYRDPGGKVIVNPPQEYDDISEIPYFDFDLLEDVSVYIDALSVYDRELNIHKDKKIKLMPILTGLGCCYRCAFCINVILKRKYRVHSAESIVQEIQRLQSKYGANAFLFLDEDFCINKKRLADFIRLVKEKRLVFSGRIWARVSYFKQESFKKMIPDLEKIGIRSIAMGAESGSQRMLDYLCKDIKQDDILIAARELSGLDITSRFSFMVGLEGEKREETIATYKLCGQLLKINPHADIAGPFIYRYYPGSPIFQELVRKHNIKLPETIEAWEGSLNSDGSLKVDVQKWTWPGFIRYVESMNFYIKLYMRMNNVRTGTSGFIAAIIKKYVLLRISCGEYFYICDYTVIKLFMKCRNAFLTNMRKHMDELKAKEGHS